MIQHLLRLKSAPQPSDAADGVAVALCHCNAAVLDRLRPALHFPGELIRPPKVIARND